MLWVLSDFISMEGRAQNLAFVIMTILSHFFFLRLRYRQNIYMERFGEVVRVIFKGLNGCILRIASMAMSLYRNKENRGKGGGRNAGITTSVGTPLVAMISLLKL